DSKLEDIGKELNVIYWGYTYCMKAVLPLMKAQKSGAIINMLSDSARVGDAMMGNYAGLKAGINGLSHSIAREMGGFGIRVNCVSPSMTMTELARGRRETEKEKLGEEKFQDLQKRRLRLYPLGRFGTPEDIANAVGFLASDKAAGWITGQTISVNGGYAIGPW
ncbi:MAG: SDR family oxidoreductase, partial [Chloroflexota bacterium]